MGPAYRTPSHRPKPPELRVIHARKATHVDFKPQLNNVFEVESCLRRIWIFDDRHADIGSIPDGIDVFSAGEAYDFLLRITCGLESAIIGETEIFGQFKEAWKLFDQESNTGRALAPWMHRLIEDTKEIRTHYLQGHGGSSYGTLVRRLLSGLSTQSAPYERRPILVIGAGQLSQSIVPYLANDVSPELLWVWNRTPDRLLDWAVNFQSRIFTPLSGDSALHAAWPQAAHVIFCVPTGTDQEREWIQKWISLSLPAGHVLHLGSKTLSPHWKPLQERGMNLLTLQDLYSLEKSQSDIRTLSHERARSACHERALLRHLNHATGGSVTLAHGWEDLAVFQNAKS